MVGGRGASVWVLISVLAVAACGGGAPHHGPQATGSRRHRFAFSGPHAPGRYRWLVSLRGAPPSVAAENRRPGTRAWRLPGPAAQVGGLAYGAVTGYVSRPTVLPGQIERIYVNGTRRVRIVVFRMGWYQGLGGREVLRSDELTVARQPPCRHDFRTGETACAWRATLSFRIPRALPSGVYLARLDAPGAARDTLFVVRSARPAPLLVQLPTSTYEAYNYWGGDSLYPGGADRVGVTGTTQGHAVSFQRPYDSVTGAGQFFGRDVAMIRFLERYRYPVAYTTGDSIDATPSQVIGPRALLDVGHSEYWSSREEHAFGHALAHGTSLLFFSSDTAAQPVRFHQSDGLRETMTALGGLAGGPRALPIGNRFRLDSARLAGSAFLGCITQRVPSLETPSYRYYDWYPNRRLQPRWLFAGTGIRTGTVIPGIVGYELDSTDPLTPRGTQVIGGGSAPCLGTGSEPGDAALGIGGGIARTTLHRVRSGAIVFDTGTLGWELGLEPVPSASPEAPLAPERDVVVLTRNLLDHVLARR